MREKQQAFLDLEDRYFQLREVGSYPLAVAAYSKIRQVNPQDGQFSDEAAEAFLHHGCITHLLTSFNLGIGRDALYQ